MFIVSIFESENISATNIIVWTTNIYWKKQRIGKQIEIQKKEEPLV